METLRRLRTEKGLSQARLAARAGLDPSTVNQIERGAREASPSTLHKLADALDVSLYELLEGEPGPKALRRSSLEPSFNDVIDERRLSRFAEAIVATAERWGEALASTGMDDAKRIGFIQAALDLSGLIEELAKREDWEALRNQERHEIVTTMQKLTEAAERGISHLHESEEAGVQEEHASQRREQIKEMTRRISA